jgi:hypothetical protein
VAVNPLSTSSSSSLSTYTVQQLDNELSVASEELSQISVSPGDDVIDLSSISSIPADQRAELSNEVNLAGELLTATASTAPASVGPVLEEENGVLAIA